MPPPSDFDLSVTNQTLLAAKTSSGGHRFSKWHHIFIGEVGGGGHYWWTSYHLSPAQRDNPPKWALDNPGVPFSFCGKAFFPVGYSMEVITDLILKAADAGSDDKKKITPVSGWGEKCGVAIKKNGANVTTAYPRISTGQMLHGCLLSEAQAQPANALVSTDASAVVAASVDEHKSPNPNVVL